MNILLVEDEKTLAYEIKDFLKKAMFVCDLAHTIAQGTEKLAINRYDFILLDLGLPDGDGLSLLTVAKTYNPDAAYIILTARGNVDDRIKGLDLGADDYLPKPFSLLELQSRMQAIARRKFGIKEETIALAEFEVNLSTRLILHPNGQLDLTRKEFDILVYLLLHKNRVLTRLQLCEHIWGSNTDDEADSNYIDVHIKNIRKKLNACGNTDWLETVRGLGYRIKLN